MSYSSLSYLFRPFRIARNTRPDLQWRTFLASMANGLVFHVLVTGPWLVDRSKAGVGVGVGADSWTVLPWWSESWRCLRSSNLNHTLTMS